MNTDAPRIALFLPTMAGGGAERVRLALARAFLDAGYQVDFVLWAGKGELLGEIPAECRVFDLNAPGFFSSILPIVGYFRKNRPDAAAAALWPLTCSVLLGRFLSGRRPVTLVSDHSILSLQFGKKGPLFRAFLRASIAVTYRMAQARVAVSHGVADDLAALSGIPRRSFTVIHNPLPQRPEPGPELVAQAEAIWGERSGPRIIGVGGMREVKNFPLLISAFSRLPRTMNARLMLLGEGRLRPALEAQARELGIADRVLMPGFFKNPVPFYRQADLFVLSSDYEGFGNVIIEAMACGLPVVSTDCPSGPAEILDNGKYGRLVPVGDAEAMSQAIAESLAATHDRQALERRAAEFSIERVANAYLDLLFPNRSTSG
jgi:glycosyltransferase involved in cell wall biosynthesis